MSDALLIPATQSFRPADSAVRPQHGFSLLEVLIALIVLAVGLLGLAALQNTGLRLGHQSYERTQATLLIYEMIDRMRANALGVTTNSYGVAMTPTPPSFGQDCSVGTCSAADMARYDMNQWIASITGTGISQTPARPILVGGQGAIVAQGGGRYDISVQWQEQNVSMQQTVRVQLP